MREPPAPDARRSSRRRGPRGRRRRLLVAVAVLGLAAHACTSSDVVQRQAQAPDDGLQATGRLDGQRVAISAGEPEVVYGDCDPGQGQDVDLCIVSRTIDGRQLALVIENPAALTAGDTLPVRSGCMDGCDDQRDQAAVVLRVGGRQIPAVGGRLRVTRAGERFAANFDLLLRGGGRLDGRFNVAPPATP